MILSEITNHPEVETCIKAYWEAKQVRDDAYADYMRDYDVMATQTFEALKLAVTQHGGYNQNGMKAYVEERISYEYKPELVRQHLPVGAAKLCIVEAVNVRALEGLAKGKLIPPELVEQCRIVAKAVEAFICPQPKETKGGKGE